MLYTIARIQRLMQIAALVLVLGMGVVLYAVLMQYKAASHGVDQAQKVIDSIVQVRTDALRAGTWLRSYGMYPSAGMLPRIRTSAGSATQAAARLLALSADSPEQGERAQVVQKELDEVLGIYLTSADIAQQLGPGALREMTIAQVRLDITAGLRAALDQMEAAERQRLETRRSVEQQRMALTETLLFAVGGLFVVAMLWMMRYSGQLVRLGQQEANQLRNAALLDPLTGLLNRRGLAAQLAKMDTRAADAANAAVLAFDLDGFKPVNDRYSHAAGDQVLKTMAQRLQQQLRNGDAIARIGGDEFVAVLPCVASHQEAVAIAQRVCTCLSFPIRLAEGAEVRVGASVGVATLHEDGKDMEGLLQAADKRMYVAKAALKRRDAAVAV
jgi:diguanylate cyclase (GGDEF)-like protein